MKSVTIWTTESASLFINHRQIETSELKTFQIKKPRRLGTNQEHVQRYRTLARRAPAMSDNTHVSDILTVGGRGTSLPRHTILLTPSLS
jgi:hypothetical protein